mmetsp:Transcript_130497/g.377485  ORF Transcript_130497/g.377485 Transcript_130497/m.377485 type:complete len:262 (+) Transcript_130497:164-949(+)
MFACSVLREMLLRLSSSDPQYFVELHDWSKPHNRTLAGLSKPSLDMCEASNGLPAKVSNCTPPPKMHRQRSCARLRNDSGTWFVKLQYQFISPLSSRWIIGCNLPLAQVTGASSSNLRTYPMKIGASAAKAFETGPGTVGSSSSMRFASRRTKTREAPQAHRLNTGSLMISSGSRKRDGDGATSSSASSGRATRTMELRRAASTCSRRFKARFHAPCCSQTAARHRRETARAARATPQTSAMRVTIWPAETPVMRPRTVKR